MKRLLQRNIEFWTHERSLTALLVYLSLTLFLALPLAGYKWLEFLTRDVLFILIALSGIFAVTPHRRSKLSFMLLAISAVLLRLISFVAQDVWLSSASDVITICFYLALTLLVLKHIFKDGPVNYFRIEGSIVIFILAGFIWASLYHLLEEAQPGSFTFVNALPIYEQFIYFSFVTMTTLGIGDIVPVHPMAKSLAIFQGMFGLLYPVLMVARLVALEIEHKRQVHKP